MNRNYGGRTRKGSRTGFDSSTRRCPSPVLPLREETGSLHIRLFLRRNNPDVVEKSVRDDRLAMWPAGKE